MVFKAVFRIRIPFIRIRIQPFSKLCLKMVAWKELDVIRSYWKIIQFTNALL